MKFIRKVMLLILIFLLVIILSKKSFIVNDFISNSVLGKNIPFTSIKNVYNRYLGKVIPFDNIITTELVFNEKLRYNNIIEHENYVELETDINYLVPSVEEGIVVFIGKKDLFNNVVIIEGEHTIWYSNINSAVKLYDKVEKGKYIGEVIDDKLYLVFKKDGDIVDFKTLI